MCLSWKMWLLLGWDLKKLIGISHLWNLKREEQLRYQSWLGVLYSENTQKGRSVQEKNVFLALTLPLMASQGHRQDSWSWKKWDTLLFPQFLFILHLCIPSQCPLTRRNGINFQLQKWTGSAFKGFYILYCLPRENQVPNFFKINPR